MKDRVLLSKLLEGTIETAVRSQIAELWMRTRWNKDDWFRHLENGGKSLDLLRTGGIPEYDNAFVALLYALRYHYAHTHLGWSTISAAHPIPSVSPLVQSSSSLQVVDFGAGTSAMYFGVFLSTAQLIDSGHNVGSITVHSIEPSYAMQAMAVALCREFRNAVVSAKAAGNLQLTALAKAFDLVKHSIHADYQEVQSTGNHRWLSALHTVYEDIQREGNLQKSLGSLNWRISPTEGFMTYNISKQKEAFELAPFKGEGRYLQLEEKLPPQSLNGLDDLCREIGFIRHSNSPYTKQVYVTSKDVAALHWSNLPPANMLGTPL